MGLGPEVCGSCPHRKLRSQTLLPLDTHFETCPLELLDDPLWEVPVFWAKHLGPSPGFLGDLGLPEAPPRKPPSIWNCPFSHSGCAWRSWGWTVNMTPALTGLTF